MLFSTLALAGSAWFPYEEKMSRLVQPALKAERLESVTVYAFSGRDTHLWNQGKHAGMGQVHEIGSISKAFTGVLLAEAVNRGEVSLRDPLSKHLPGAPAWAKKISLEHLATHTSGLPRLPPGLSVSGKGGPYAEWDDAKLLATLKQIKPGPTGTMAYSNLGGALIGRVLENASGKTYPELLAERITTPLGMAHTDVDGTAPIQGYTSGGEPTDPWTLNAFEATGGIHSTAQDLMLFMQAHHDPKSPLAASLELASKTRFATPETKIGLFWHRTPDGVVWHNGQTGGYHCILAFSPGMDQGVVVLSNTASDLVDSIAFGALRAIRDLDPEPLPMRETLVLPDHLLAVLAGKYGPVEVQNDRGALWLKLEGQPRYRMWATDPTHFYLLEAPVEIELDQTKMVFQQEGIDTQTWPRQ